ncbi:MAG: TIGR02530 family flagellar biosynthesis protein [Candidatus Eisenbacteria bacterium]
MTEIRGPTFSQAFAHGVEQVGRGSPQGATSTRATGEFSRVFDEALQGSPPVRFSRHAEERIRSRGIQITPHELDRLNQAVRMAEARGAKESLVVSGPLSYVVDVPGRTVVTALYGEQARGHVFTNIDSAVVI